jgi:hypothetical protein
VNSNSLLEQEKKKRENNPAEKYRAKRIEVLEMDELFTYVKKPRNSEGRSYFDKRIWTAVDRFGGKAVASRGS